MLKYEHVNVAVSRTNILNDINITFPKGQITTIIGPNGCGKTTLLQCLNGCSKVTAGTITVDNENILSLPLKEACTGIDTYCIRTCKCIIHNALKDNTSNRKSHTGNNGTKHTRETYVHY